MRLTEDAYTVAEYEQVWEILFVYLNEEANEAVPSQVMVKDIPLRYKIWKVYENCLRECSMINKPKVISDDDERRILIPVKTKQDERDYQNKNSSDSEASDSLETKSVNGRAKKIHSRKLPANDHHTAKRKV